MFDKVLLQPLFSTPVAVYALQNFSNNYCDVDNYNTEEFFVNEKQTNVVNHKSKNILLENGYEDLKQKIDIVMSNFVYEVLCFPREATLKLSCSWLTIGLPGSKTRNHYHNNSVYSGILYLKSIPEKSGDLIFSTHNSTYSTNTVRPKPTELNLLNSTAWTIEPKTGDVVVFPSHLAHEITENISGENRAAIAFNYFFEGNISEGETDSLYL